MRNFISIVRGIVIYLVWMQRQRKMVTRRMLMNRCVQKLMKFQIIEAEYPVLDCDRYFIFWFI